MREAVRSFHSFLPPLERGGGTPKGRDGEVLVLRLLLSLCQQLEDLDGVGCRTFSDLIAAAIPQKTCGFPGTPMQWILPE